MPQPKTNRSGSLCINAGPFEARLAESADEILQAQQLRYQVLFVDGGGQPSAQKVSVGADIDQWDANASHIIVTDSRTPDNRVVGTLRLISNLDLPPDLLFYTEQYFDLDGLRAHYGHVAEFGRFCVDPDTRSGVVLGLIWKIAVALILDRKIDLMFGSASFPGVEVEEHRNVFAYLGENSLAPDRLALSAKEASHSLADFRATDSAGDNPLRELPPLIRGYLKIGGRCSPQAIVDPVFNTTIVCVYVESANFSKVSTALVPNMP